MFPTLPKLADIAEGSVPILLRRSAWNLAWKSRFLYSQRGMGNEYGQRAAKLSAGSKGGHNSFHF